MLFADRYRVALPLQEIKSKEPCGFIPGAPSGFFLEFISNKGKMITEIGIVAGEIWHFLDKHGKVELEQLTVGVGKSREIILMSLGWLARKGHVLVEQEGNTYKVSLRDIKQTSD